MKKKLLFISILCILFFSFGYFSSDENKISDINARTESNNNIDISIKDGVNEDIADKYIKDINKQPSELTENCKKIIFTDENLSDKFNLSSIDNAVLAVTLDDIIYINTNKYDKYVITHELFHVYDFANGWVSKTDAFTKIYNDEKDIIKVSPGNNENAQEFIASAAEEYFYNPDDLKLNAPETFNFIDSLFN